MKFAIIGGTHGNEPVGIKALDYLTLNSFRHHFQTFIGNPEAYQLQKRFVDSDLNRAFGKLGQSTGYESTRAKELTNLIEGKFDFVLDLHTTTSNMGLTLILTRTDERSLQAACYLKKLIPEVKIIVSIRAGSECPYTSALASSALTLEVGPVANNVIKTSLVKITYKMITELLNFDFKEKFPYDEIECFHTFGIQHYPGAGDWMIHESIDGHDFNPFCHGDPLFTNIHNDITKYEGRGKKASAEQEVYPLFVNEAAYQNNKIAMELATKKNLLQAIS